MGREPPNATGESSILLCFSYSSSSPSPSSFVIAASTSPVIWIMLHIGHLRDACHDHCSSDFNLLQRYREIDTGTDFLKLFFLSVDEQGKQDALWRSSSCGFSPGRCCNWHAGRKIEDSATIANNLLEGFCLWSANAFGPYSSSGSRHILLSERQEM